MLGYALVEGVRSLDLGVLAWDEAGPYVAGGAILPAAIFQLSPLKEPEPAPLPQPERVRLRALAARSRRRTADGDRARSGVRGV
jgi:hypothetical protein